MRKAKETLKPQGLEEQTGAIAGLFVDGGGELWRA
jgi:hypothetical protein